jgi:hypothetical protein
MTGAARRKAEEDCSGERSILRRMSPVVAPTGHAAAVAACPLLRDERICLRRGPRSEIEPKPTLST